MTVELGILLGAYNGSQSFEQVGSWTVANQTSLSLQTSDVHSSASGGLLEVYSSASSAATLRYDYRQNDDAFSRWFTDVTTHHVVAYGWARIDTAGNSGDIRIVLPGDNTTIPHATSLQRFRLETDVISGDDLRLRFNRDPSTGSYGLFLDDLLVAVDVLDLMPSWGLAEQRQQHRAEHTTMDGVLRTYTWHETLMFDVPLVTVPSSAADTINRWYDSGRNLVFTLDTSDTQQTWICRLVNPGRPFATFRRPYFNVHDGVLNLQAIGGGLEF